ncbi:thiamine phosphate synthase, partial [bacterium]|nr:thiamine phosphate synthase [bacterium]
MTRAQVLSAIDTSLRDLSENLYLLRGQFEAGRSAERAAGTLLGADSLFARLDEQHTRVSFEERLLRANLAHELTADAAKIQSATKSQAGTPMLRAAADAAELPAFILKRIKTCQGLARTLEEYFGFFKQQRAAEFYKKTRFELYEIEREMASRYSAIESGPSAREAVGKVSGQGRPLHKDSRVARALSACPLYFVLDQSLCKTRDPLRIGFDAVSGGVRMLQLRFKSMPTRELIDLARKLKQVCAQHDCLLFVNDRLDVALLSGADGVHLGEEDARAAEVRRAAPDLLIGATARRPKDALAAQAGGADYIGSGSVYVSLTKPGLPVIGIKG